MKRKEKRNKHKFIVDIKFVTAIKDEIEKSNKTWLTTQNLVKIGFFTSNGQAGARRRDKTGPAWRYYRVGKNLMCVYKKEKVLSWIENIIKRGETYRIATFKHFKLAQGTALDPFNTGDVFRGTPKEFMQNVKENAKLQSKPTASGYEFNTIKYTKNQGQANCFLYNVTATGEKSQALTLNITIPLDMIKVVDNIDNDLL